MRKGKSEILRYISAFLLVSFILQEGLYAETVRPTVSQIDAVWANHLTWKAKQSSASITYRESIIREALRIDPKAEEAVERLFYLLLEKDQPVLAGVVLEYALDQGMECEALTRALNSYKVTHRTTREAMAAEKTKSFDMRTSDEKLQLVRTYIEQQNFIAAEDRLQKLIEEEPQNLEYFSVLGQIYIMTREAFLGSILYSYLYKHQPDDVETVNNYAFVLRVLHQYQDALDLLLAFDRTHSPDEMIIDNIVSLSGSLDLLDVASKYTERWVSDFPDSDRGWLAHAKLQLYCGNLEEARMAVERCLLLTPDDMVRPLIYSIEIARRQKQLNEARKRIEQLKSIVSEEDFETMNSKYVFTDFYEIEGDDK